MSTPLPDETIPSLDTLNQMAQTLMVHVDRGTRISRWIRRLNSLYIDLPYPFLILQLLIIPVALYAVITTPAAQTTIYTVAEMSNRIILVVALYTVIRRLDKIDKPFFTYIDQQIHQFAQGPSSDNPLSIEDSSDGGVYLGIQILQEVLHHVITRKDSLFIYTVSTIAAAAIAVNLFSILLISFVFTNFGPIIVVLWIASVFWLGLTSAQVLEYRYWTKLVRQEEEITKTLTIVDGESRDQADFEGTETKPGDR